MIKSKNQFILTNIHNCCNESYYKIIKIKFYCLILIIVEIK